MTTDFSYNLDSRGITECRNMLVMPKGYLVPRSPENLKKLERYVKRKFPGKNYKDRRTKAFKFMMMHDSEFHRVHSALGRDSIEMPVEDLKFGPMSYVYRISAVNKLELKPWDLSEGNNYVDIHIKGKPAMRWGWYLRRGVPVCRIFTVSGYVRYRLVCLEIDLRYLIAKIWRGNENNNPN